MASRIEHSARYSHPVDAIHAAFTSEQYWKDRVEEIGGPNAQLTDVGVADGNTVVHLAQSIPEADLPSMVTAVRPGDLIINRTETWHRIADGRFDGTFSAAVEGVPAKITGAVTVVPDGDGVSAVALGGTVEVKIPLFGGKIESAIAEQLGQLLEREDDFTRQWLDRNA